MTRPPDNPFRPVEPYTGLVLGEVLSKDQGQARLVCLLDSHPGWIYKEYKDVVPAGAVAQLDKLISMPARLTPVERQLVGEATSWPAARVTKGERTWGVLMPLAPEVFKVDLQVFGGVKRRLLNVDWLAQPEADQRARGIAAPSPADRVEVCASIGAVAELFERYGVVYLDWSFTNAFWSDRIYRAYVIDIDGCSFGPRKMIESPGWGDPFFPMGTDGGHLVDRYRVALLVARCLTAERGAADAAVACLAQLAADQPSLRQVHRLIARAVQAEQPQDRPPLSGLAEALRKAQGELAPPLLAAQPNSSGWLPPPVWPTGPDRADPPPDTRRSFTPESPDPPDSGSYGSQGGAAVAAVVVGLLVLIIFVAFVVL